MASKPEKYTDAKLQAFAEDRIADCVSYDGSDRKGRRELALAYKAGDMPDLVPGKDQSSVVSQDLADAIAWLLPDLMRVFCASDKIVSYEPENPGDEEHAQQATDYVNWLFLRECDGEMLLRDVLDDGLTLGNGVIKHWWDPTPEYRIHTFTDLSEDQFAELVASDDVEVLEHSAKPDPSAGGFQPLAPGAPRSLPAPSGPDAAALGGAAGQGLGPLSGLREQGVPDQPAGPRPAGSMAQDAGIAGVPGGAWPAAGLADGSPLAVPQLAAAADLVGSLGLGPALLEPPPPPLLHDVKVRRTVRTGRIRIVAVPDEDFGIESAATGLNERECRFCYHRETPTRSQLIERGYDKDMVWELGSVAESTTDADRRRRGWYDGNAGRDDYEDRAAERVEVFECYALLDYDGDGVAEWHQIIMAGPSGSQKLLYQTEWGGMLPFTDVVPDPVPHVWRGRSLYDRLRDIQRVNTVLTRKALDNLYQVLEPGRQVDASRIKNMDSVYDRRLGSVTLTNGPPSDIVKDDVVPFVAAPAMQMVEQMRGVAERRVGVGEQSAGLSADALQNQTATAIAATQSTAGMRKEDYARNIQMGLRRLFSAILHLTCEHQDRPRTIRLRDKWVDVDPRSWNAEMDVTVNTGLGAGNRDRDLAMLQGILAEQKVMLGQLAPMIGFDNPICGIDKYVNTIHMMIEAAGMRSPSQFVGEATPEVLQAIAQTISQKQQAPDPKTQAAMAQVQLDQEKAKANFGIEQFRAQNDDARAKQKLGAELQAREVEAAHRRQMEVDKANHDLQVSREEAALKAQLMREEAAAKLQMMREEAAQRMQIKREELLLEAQLKREQMAIHLNSPSATNIRDPDE